MRQPEQDFSDPRVHRKCRILILFRLIHKIVGCAIDYDIRLQRCNDIGNDLRVRDIKLRLIRSGEIDRSLFEPLDECLGQLPVVCLL